MKGLFHAVRLYNSTTGITFSKTPTSYFRSQPMTPMKNEDSVHSHLFLSEQQITIGNSEICPQATLSFLAFIKLRNDWCEREPQLYFLLKFSKGFDANQYIFFMIDPWKPEYYDLPLLMTHQTWWRIIFLLKWLSSGIELGLPTVWVKWHTHQLNNRFMKSSAFWLIDPSSPLAQMIITCGIYI